MTELRNVTVRDCPECRGRGYVRRRQCPRCNGRRVEVTQHGRPVALRSEPVPIPPRAGDAVPRYRRERMADARCIQCGAPATTAQHCDFHAKQNNERSSASRAGYTFAPPI